jgi:DNA-binding NtrC family response regulator
MSSLAPAIFVFEKSPRWEAELKRRLANRNVLVRPCRSAKDLVSLCRQAPGSVAVVDFAAGTADGLRLVEALFGLRLGISPVVIGSRETEDLEWPTRDLGAAAFVTDRLGGDALADICRRMLEGVGAPTRSASEEVRRPTQTSASG